MPLIIFASAGVLRLVFVPLRGGGDTALWLAESALNYLVCYGFIQTMARQITWNNGRIIETMELLGLALVCGLDCDIFFFNLISLRRRGCLTAQEQRTREKWSLCGQWSGAIFSLFFFFLLHWQKLLPLPLKRKEVGNTARVDSTMLYSHFIRHYNTFMIMLLNMWSMFFHHFIITYTNQLNEA